jgi:hypothetical protein
MINRLPLQFRHPNGAHATGRTAAGEASPSTSRLTSAAHQAVRKAARCVGAYPVASLATAFVGGLVFGRWIKGK